MMTRNSLAGGGNCSAGHSVVQDAFSRKNNNKYAVKVFLDRDHFRAEATLFAAFLPWLRQGLSRELAAAAAAAGRAAPECAPKPSAFLPPVYQLLDNADSRLRDARGQRLPPVLVLGKGMSLQEWAATSASDLFSAIAVRSPFLADFVPAATVVGGPCAGRLTLYRVVTAFVCAGGLRRPSCPAAGLLLYTLSQKGAHMRC